MNDILSQFRRSSPANTPPAPASSGEKEPYIAFKTRDHVQMLRIVVGPELEHSPSNTMLLNVTSDGTKGTYFVIVYSILAVEVYGRNLDKVVHAIRRRSADFIQQYNAAVWPEPDDQNAPFISSIKVHFKEDGLPSTGATEDSE